MHCVSREGLTDFGIGHTVYAYYALKRIIWITKESPLSDREYLIAPKVVTVSFGLEPAYSAVESLSGLTCVNRFYGLAEWIEQTARSLPPDVAHRHQIVFDALGCVFYDLIPDKKFPSFLAYVDALAALDPYEMRDGMLEKLREIPFEWSDPGTVIPPAPSTEKLLTDLDVFLNWIKVVWPDQYVPETYAEAHALLNDPPTMQDLMVSHMRQMWPEILEPEWKRNLPLLQESVEAFQKLDYSGLTLFEAIRAVTGRDLRSHWGRVMDRIEHVIFVPSAHTGPYVTKFTTGTTLRLVFGARLPKGYQAVGSSALSRSELLIRLNALADDTRLRILELLAREGELCAQDIITLLDLMQSSLSRHLSQLSATGYITERRREVAKCYSLNTERLEDTTRALTQFLRKK